MKFLATYLLLLLSILFSTDLIAQLPANQDNKASLRKAYYGGIQIHTGGWGATFTYSKFNTFKNKRTLSIELVSMKNGKEFKRSATNDETAKGYFYGKLNNLTQLRLKRGTKKIIYEKLRKQGVEISFTTKYGITLGFLKPVYLEVLKLTANQRVETVSEKYNPELHNINNIYGRSSNLSGLSELSIIPGGTLSGSFIFDFSADRKKVKSIELGISLDAYYKRLPIMTQIQNKFLYPSAFINFQFGKKTL